MFSVGCAALGMDAVLVDDFEDAVNLQHGGGPLALHAKYGVTVVKRNVARILSTSLRHLSTRSPPSTRWSTGTTRPSGYSMTWPGLCGRGACSFWASPTASTCANASAVPLGIGSWSLMQDWYEEKTFRGHVREPDVTDLRYIARDMALEGVRIVGRNWLGYISRFPLVRLLTPAIDRPLQLFPSLCADLYLLGRKPAQS